MHGHDTPFDWNDVYEHAVNDAGEVTDCHEPDALVLETIATLPAGRMLDVGCGAGGLLLALAGKGWEVSGIDIAPRAIAAARARFKRQGLSAALETEDAAKWRPDGTFDLVTNCFALPFEQQDQQVALRMMQDAVAPGGTLILKDFDSTMRRPKRFAGIHLPTVHEITSALDRLEIVRAEVVETPVHHHADKHAHDHETWTAAFVIARHA